jgi:hypothetical protein
MKVDRDGACGTKGPYVFVVTCNGAGGAKGPYVFAATHNGRRSDRTRRRPSTRVADGQKRKTSPCVGSLAQPYQIIWVDDAPALGVLEKGVCRKQGAAVRLQDQLALHRRLKQPLPFEVELALLLH